MVHSLSKVPCEGRTRSALEAHVLTCGRPGTKPFWLYISYKLSKDCVAYTTPKKEGLKYTQEQPLWRKLERKETWRKQSLSPGDALIHRCSHSPWASLAPSHTSVHRLLPKGLPGNIFLVNVYIFGDSWFICGQSVPGKTQGTAD